MRKWIGYLSFGAILVLTLSFFNPIRAAIQQIAGLAVAETASKWNNVKDAAVGDNLTNGILVGGNYIFDGTNWDRARGDTTNGLDVDVTRLPYVAADNSTNATTKLPVLSGRANAAAPTWTENYQVPISVDLSGNIRTSISGVSTVTGTETPSDTYANPTDALNTMSLLALWNGTTWDRAKKAQQTMANSLSVVIASDQSAVRITKDTSGTAFYAVKLTNVAAVSVNIPFGFTSKKVVVETSSGNTSEICVDWIGGTAVCPALDTAGDDRVGAGRTITLDDYAVTSISVISSSGTQTISVRAWN